MLYRSNGSLGDGSLVLPASHPGSPRNVREITPHDGILYFRVKNEIWRSDGTYPLKDIHPTGYSIPNYLSDAAGILYFTANDGVQGRKLRRSDGTSTGTVLVGDINPGTASFAMFNGVVYFRANDDVNGASLTVPAFSGGIVTIAYLIDSGETSPDLTATAVSLIPGSTLQNSAGNSGPLLLPTSNLDANANLIVNPPVPTMLSLVTINDAAAQRSRVISLILDFAMPQNAGIFTSLGTITLTRGTTVVQTGATGATAASPFCRPAALSAARRLRSTTQTVPPPARELSTAPCATDAGCCQFPS